MKHSKKCVLCYPEKVLAIEFGCAVVRANTSLLIIPKQHAIFADLLYPGELLVAAQLVARKLGLEYFPEMTLHLGEHAHLDLDFHGAVPDYQ